MWKYASRERDRETETKGGGSESERKKDEKITQKNRVWVIVYMGIRVYMQMY